MDLIRFKPSDHSYWIGDTLLESVTTVVKSLTPEFDRERVSLLCAKKAKVSQEEILAEWGRKGEEARERGTMVHAYIEDKINGRHDPILDSLNERLPEQDAFDKAWSMFQSTLKAEVVAQEVTVGD
jgi:hypothetical protein